MRLYALVVVAIIAIEGHIDVRSLSKCDVTSPGKAAS